MKEYDVINGVIKKHKYHIYQNVNPTVVYSGTHRTPWWLMVVGLLIILRIFLAGGVSILRLISIFLFFGLVYFTLRERSQVRNLDLAVQKFVILEDGLELTDFENRKRTIHKDQISNLQLIEFEDSADEIYLGFTELETKKDTILMFCDKKSEALNEALAVIAQFATDIWNDE